MNVFVVEDDEIQLKALEAMFSALPELELKCFASGEEALAAVQTSPPRMIFTDIKMPGIGGLELIRKARETAPDTAIVVLSGLDDPDTIFRALKAGAVGYLIKPMKKDDIKEIIKEVEMGGSPISSSIARLIIEEFRNFEMGSEFIPSEKEREVLEKVTRGFTYKEVADALHLSIHTVHWHMKNITAKLYAKNKKDVILKAKLRGIVS